MFGVAKETMCFRCEQSDLLSRFTDKDKKKESIFFFHEIDLNHIRFFYRTASALYGIEEEIQW